MSGILSRVLLCVLALATIGGANAWAQKAVVQSRVVDQVDDARTVRLHGNVHPMARPANDQGALPDSQPLTRMLLLLQRSPEQELALKQLLDAQQTKGSPNYHAWLTPEDFGKQFGPSDVDVQAVTDWLTRQGLQVKKVAAGRTAIEFDGNTGQVRNAFHTEIHRYNVNGKEHFANASDPAIPAALSPVVAGVVALHNFQKHAQVRTVGNFQRDRTTGQITPQFTYTDKNGQFFALGPADFAKIYNIPSGADGSGQSIAVVGQSNIDITDVQQFRSMFGLPANDPQIIVNGPDPGLVGGDELESDLDVEWAGAVAPAAKVIFVTSLGTISNPGQVSGGVDLSALYAVDNDVAPILSDSYGLCEAALGTTGNAFYLSLWQQAAAEGITVAVAAGDNGPAGCDPNPNVDPNAATQGLAVSGLASTPYNVAVGGTDFDTPTAADLAIYWKTTNTSTTAPVAASALGYIVEIPWDNSTCAQNYLTTPSNPVACSTVDTQFGDDLAAASGGPSNCATLSSAGTSCTAGYPKPTFQTGLTPGDNARDIPDISLFAGNGVNSTFYIVCEQNANANNAPCSLTTSASSGVDTFSGIGGTSGGTPTFAAIIALVNQKTGQRQGNANYVLYNLAAKENYANCNSSSFTNHATPAPASCVFYDITKGTNTVACDPGSPNCSDTGSSGFGVIIDNLSAYSGNGNPAFKAVQGYDLATGLGSINVANLLNSWSSATRTATSTTLSDASGATNTSGQNFSVTVTVSPTPPNGETVSLTALAPDSTTILGSISGPSGTSFTLSGGKATVTTNLLPPGTAFIKATYGGDATLALSTSLPLPLVVSGANQVSKTTVGWVGFDSNGNPLSPSTSAQAAVYGSPYILQIAVTNTSGTSCGFNYPNTRPTAPCPTGTVKLTDGGNALNDWPIAGQLNATSIAKLNNQGIAEDQPIQLSPGSHSLQAAFTSGDTNFQNSTSNILSVTITQAATTTLLVSTSTSIMPGASVTLTAYVVTQSNGAGPTGSMTFSNGTTSLGSATCQPTSGAADTNPPIQAISAGSAYCVATLTTTSISALYPPPTSGPRVPGMPLIPFYLVALSALLFALGWRWIPQPRRRVYAYIGVVAFALLAVGIVGCGGGSSSGGGGATSRTITASYAGDTNYGGSSGTMSITVQ
jgi:hypothetical protein